MKMLSHYAVALAQIRSSNPDSKHWLNLGHLSPDIGKILPAIPTS